MSMTSSMRPAARRAARNERSRQRSHQVKAAHAEATQSQADLARVRAAAKDVTKAANSRVASELSKNLRGI